MASYTKIVADFKTPKFEFQHGSVDVEDVALLAAIGYAVYRVPPVKQFVDDHARDALEAVKDRFRGGFSKAA